MLHSQPNRPSSGRWAAAVGWALLPLVTCGFATPFSIGFAAYRLASIWQAAAAAVYTLCLVSFLIPVMYFDTFEDIPEPLSTLISIALVVSWVGGLIHSLFLLPAMARPRPAGQQRRPPYTPPPPNVHQRTTAPTAMRRAGEPEWIGHYRVLESLGRGGQGSVYLAVAPDGARVAVKVLNDLVDDVARARFAREVDAARRVATFSTARLLDVNITGQLAYIVSEYVAGPSLEQLVRNHGPRDEDGLTRLALSTAGALAAIHKAGVVHRDFKPSNVLIGPDGPRVIDFGIARALDQVTMTSGKMVGTPPYMSPEQLSGEPVGPPSDVFSWAVTMMFAATGRPAFGEDTVPAVFNRVLTFHPDLSPMPPGMRGIVGACLNKRPENRPAASDVMLAIVH
ncbi:serine/threonine-protein kinase [Nonomuraea sp. NPDC050536]|uniref:serine/threonine-protein kinase n=1 Tax=Nonomuraea sp. NPDC050536 TaxID=3364366 RepID=UPI0037C8E7B2